MKTKEEIKKRSIFEAMELVFCPNYQDMLKNYDFLCDLKKSGIYDIPYTLIVADAYSPDISSVTDAIDIVNNIADQFEKAMLWAQEMSLVHCKYEHEFYFEKAHGWYLHVNNDCNSAGDIINRQLMVFDKNGNVVKDSRLDDDVWKFDFKPNYDIKLENEAVFDKFSITDEEYEIRLAESGILAQINKK